MVRLLNGLSSAATPSATTTATRPGSNTSTGSTPSCDICPAPRAARTGSATASNPTNPAPDSSPAAAPPRPTTARHLGLGGRRVLVSRTGPARPSPNTGPIGPPSSAKRCEPPACSPPSSNGWPPTFSNRWAAAVRVDRQQPRPDTYTLTLLRAFAERDMARPLRAGEVCWAAPF